MGTSLWLVPQPSSSAAATLQGVIESISKAHSSPSFPPHATLASLPESISLAEINSCLSSQEQVMLSFEQVRTGPTFYQSVFIAIQPSPQLSQLHQHVHESLRLQPKTPEFPHLSIYYGDEGKDEILQKLQEDGIIHKVDGAIKVGDIREFLAMEVWVVYCVGKPEEWSVIGKVALKPPNSYSSIRQTPM
ncbi:2',3'-cyclic-nucleotide 3'-phosphodiesterase [Gautieria morchelliformis]|nr:2',3'-cyclic-nucleotide 3'-phosphodiesterase [Gautieria morchelliformis]